MTTATKAPAGHSTPFGDVVYVTRGEIMAHLKATSSEMTRLVQRKGFPAPAFHLGPRSPRWVLADVEAWVADGGVDVTDDELSELDQATMALFSRPANRRGPQRKRAVR